MSVIEADLGWEKTENIGGRRWAFGEGTDVGTYYANDSIRNNFATHNASILKRTNSKNKQTRK